MDMEVQRVYPESVADFMMCDAHQEEAFGILGSARAPFAGIADWPWLDEAIAVRSQELLDSRGEEEWQRFGGQRNEATGTPTFRASSPVPAQIVRTIANEHGGLLYRDDDGSAWAVRLLPGGPHAAADIRIGLAVNWYGSPLPLDPHSRHECLKAIAERLHDAGNRDGERAHLDQVANRLRLCGRAEQALWAIQRAVRTQCRSLVVLPDVTLASTIWGGHTWPKNWRQDCFEVLVSLSHLRIQRIRLAANGWRPQPDLHSVAVASVERRGRGRPGRACFDDKCPLRGSGKPHGHFLIQVGLGLLGVLECYRLQGSSGEREFNFSQPPTDEDKRRLREARNRGQLVTVSVPTKVFGPAKWSGLSARQISIIQALIREVVRPAKRRRTQREDGAELFRGNRVPGRTAKEMTVCPGLDAQAAHVAFNGNGCRRGRGYGLVGRRRTGWLCKCGYEAPEDTGQLRREVRQFFDDLDVVAGILGLVVVGYDGREGRWIDFAALRSMAGNRASLAQLQQFEVRIYGPEDYHDRLRGHFEQQGQMMIPRTNGELPALPSVDDRPGLPQDLQARMRELNVSEAMLASELDYTQQFVSALLNGRKSWPPAKEAEAMRYLDSVQSSRG